MNHLYKDKTDIIHLCEGGRMVEGNPDTYCVWTLCGKDVPANKSYKAKQNTTCKTCLSIHQRQGLDMKQGKELAIAVANSHTRKNIECVS